MLHHFQRFIRDTDGAVTINMTVLAAAIVGIGLTSVAAVTVGVTDLGSKFENGVTNAGTVVLCMFSNQNDCAGNGGGEEDGGEEEVADDDNIGIEIGPYVVSHDLLSVSERDAERLANEMRLYSADDVKAFVEQANNEFYMAISSGDLEKTQMMLDYYYLGVTVLNERFGFEGAAETAAAEFERAVSYFEQNLDRLSESDPRIIQDFRR